MADSSILDYETGFNLRYIQDSGQPLPKPPPAVWVSGRENRGFRGGTNDGGPIEKFILSAIPKIRKHFTGQRHLATLPLFYDTVTNERSGMIWITVLIIESIRMADSIKENGENVLECNNTNSTGLYLDIAFGDAMSSICEITEFLLTKPFPIELDLKRMCVGLWKLFGLGT
uniref:PMD domain-containing protein n=1 Tax=Heterorhabditis bacteriophora TaxID=37862 RepID=A0A1I7WYF9_HETBA